MPSAFANDWDCDKTHCGKRGVMCAQAAFEDGGKSFDLDQLRAASGTGLELWASTVKVRFLLEEI